MSADLLLFAAAFGLCLLAYGAVEYLLNRRTDIRFFF